MHETDLIIEHGEQTFLFPPFSACECTQTLIPLSQGILRRTVNGELIHVGGHRALKFISTLTCKDQVAPAFGMLTPGTPLRVGCIQSLTQAIPAGVTRVTLARDPVRVRLYDREGNDVSVTREGCTLALPSDFLGGFATYFPWLFMLVKSWYLETDEWEQTVTWKVELEER